MRRQPRFPTVTPTERKRSRELLRIGLALGLLLVGSAASLPSLIADVVVNADMRAPAEADPIQRLDELATAVRKLPPASHPQRASSAAKRLTAVRLPVTTPRVAERTRSNARPTHNQTASPGFGPRQHTALPGIESLLRRLPGEQRVHRLAQLADDEVAEVSGEPSIEIVPKGRATDSTEDSDDLLLLPEPSSAQAGEDDLLDAAGADVEGGGSDDLLLDEPGQRVPRAAPSRQDAPGSDDLLGDDLLTDDLLLDDDLPSLDAPPTRARTTDGPLREKHEDETDEEDDTEDDDDEGDDNDREDEPSDSKKKDTPEIVSWTPRVEVGEVPFDPSVFTPNPDYTDLEYSPEVELDIWRGKYLNPTERPWVELGRGMYLPGSIPPSQTWLGEHNLVSQHFLVYGDYRAGMAYIDGGRRDSWVLGASIEPRLRLEVD